MFLYNVPIHYFGVSYVSLLMPESHIIQVCGRMILRGVIYPGPEKSLMKSNRRFKIEYHAFRESADFISRASSDTDDSFSEEIEKAV